MNFFASFFIKLTAFSLVFLSGSVIIAQTSPSDSLRFPIKDRRGDAFSQRNNNPFDFKDTSLIKKEIVYNPKTGQYEIVEKIGRYNYRKPSFLTFDELYKIKAKESEQQYFKERANALTLLNRKLPRPKHTVYNSLFDRIFGAGDNPLNGLADEVTGLSKKAQNALKVDIKPQGSVDILAGYIGQETLNPTLPEAARKNGGFDFNMNTNFTVNASIGNKLKLPLSYNTLANFDYLNQLRLDYKGKDDEILKSVEAGNIAWQSKGTLVPSAQNLFGIKTQLQFGKLFVTAAIANQRSQRQNATLQGGANASTFQKRLDDYEDNRHFLLSQYFRNNYNKVMGSLPIANSQVQIQRIEVWITNRTGATTDARDVVALMDLGENRPFNPNIISLTNNALPQNGANNLYASLAGDQANRNPATITTRLSSRGLRPVDDFEKTFARKLNSNEYYFNQQAGFISINGFLQPDEVLGVAFQYSYNGRTYQVGEFSQDVALDSTQGVQKVLFLKLLKATSARTNLPIWQLMMKNVYSLDVAGISREDFKLNVLYEQPSGGLLRNLPESNPAVEGQPLLRILNLDRLNNRNDPQPDGVFDYVENFTILPQQGKIVFPLLEPFGKDLDTLAFGNQSTALKQKYVFYQLYDSIKAIAQTFANVNRFIMQGQAKGTGGSDIYLGAFNIPPGSVRVNAGGQVLQEGTDYTVDYNMGSVKILNQAITNSGIPVNVSFENNGAFGLQQRGFFALRADYIASKKLSIGLGLMRLNERPFFTKMGYGEDPIRNTMYSGDVSYRSDLPSLTRLLNKLPFYDTKAMSNIVAYGEAAYLKPGHPPQIGSGDQGLIYIDDFEGTRSSLDLRFPLISWALASTPQGNPRFPEATLTDSLDYNKNRAKLAWYNVEPNLQDRNANNNPLRRNLAELSDPRVRMVFTNELFPQVTTNITNTQAITFDLAYYPNELGPYNFENNTSQVNAQGRLNNPRARWAGIMRSIDQTDFETNNFEFVEFWLQDPFIKKPNSIGGKLFLNLGNISEDVLKDGKRFYENGLNTPTSPAAVDSSNAWGKAPVNPIQITQAFSNNPDDRPFQDVGFDGLDNAAERRKRQAYINRLTANFGASSPIVQRALRDPSNDDYVWFRDPSFEATQTGILGRYKNFNNPQGNSPVSSGGTEFSPAATLYPDNEDLNRDNTLNETEEYYEYEVNLQPNMRVGSTKYVTDRRIVPVRYADGSSGNENWFLFRVPIRDYSRKVGQIPDFKSIRFIRMYLNDFEDSTVLRFARFDLVRNQWRQFIYNLDTTGLYTPINPGNTTFNTLAVNLEENSSRTPVNYLIPPGIERVQQLSNNGVNLLQNEQAMSMQVRNLQNGDARATFKTLNLDLRQFGKLSMFTHAESIAGATPVRDNELNLVVRIGQDFLNNFYEIKLPLKITPPGIYRNNEEQTLLVWPKENDLDFALQDLVNLKILRNNTPGASNATIFRKQVGNKTFSILGNPNLGEVRGILAAVQNALDNNTAPLNAEVWINELRLSKIDEKGAYAALGRVDVQLADLGRISVSANTYSNGWGSIEQRVNERARNTLTQFDIAATIEAGKLLPKKLRLSVPVFASINKNIRTPEYDPYDMDVLYKDKLNGAKNARERDSIRNAAVDETTIRTLNFTNVRVMQNGKPKLFAISNFDISYSFTQTIQTSPLIANNNLTKHRGNFGYTYNNASNFKEPFRKFIKNQAQWLNFIKDFNFNLKPSLLSFRADINRQFGQYIPRIVNTDLVSQKVQRVDTTFDKFFTFDRFYNLRWDLTRSLNLDFSATNNGRVDEPFGAINTDAKRDSVWRNLVKGGRTTLYTQKAIAGYTLPFSKFGMLDWIVGKYNYSTNYSWIAASLIAPSLGNFLENGQENTFTAELDFTRLYSKNRWLRSLENAPAPKQPKKNTPTTKSKKNLLGLEEKTRNEVLINPITKQFYVGKEKREVLQKWRQQKRDVRTAERLQKANEPVEMSGVVRGVGKLLTMLKRVSVSYTENYRSRVPGYMDSTQFLGNNFKSMQPGLDYVFGKQPDTNWLNRKAAQGVITRDSLFNFLYRQNFEQKLNITMQVEPVREFMVDINLEQSFSKEYTQLFKDTLNNGSPLRHLNPYAAGGFSVTYISFGTLFRNTNPNDISETFKQFQNNRAIISRRVAETNPYWVNGGRPLTADGYAVGYGRYAQDVLIPAFLAAYTGKDPNAVALINQSNSGIKSNPFRRILPKPNWRLTYTGLSKIPALAKKFTAITFTHGYNPSTLSMNSFNSALNFADPFRAGAPGFIDTVSGNYIPFFLVPNITMQESFAPLFGIDVTTTSQLNIKFEYRKSRTLSLSLIDYQLAENNSTEWIVGMGYRIRGLKLPFSLPGMKGNKKLENDLSFRLDISNRNDAISNSRLDQSNAYGTGGQKVITIQPTIDYVLNNRLNIKLFFDQRRVTPYISTSAPTINTRAGLQVRISLAN